MTRTLNMVDMNGSSPVLIERAGALVSDPLDPYRPHLGERYAQDMDDVATYHGLSLIGMSEPELEQRLAELESSLESLLDPARAELAQDWSRELDAADDELMRAQEGMYVLQGRSRSTRGRDTGLERALERQERTLGAAEGRAAGAYGRYENAGLRYDGDGDLDMDSYDATGDEQAYLREWVATNGAAFAQKIAVERELAIREELRDRELSGWSQEVPEDVEFKLIGTGADTSVLLAERRMMARGWAERLHGHGTPRLITRDDVPKPPMLDSSYNALGAQRREDLIAQLAPLKEWVSRQPDDWIKARHSELAATPPADFDRAAAMRAQRIEMWCAGFVSDRDKARANAERFRLSDPERAAVEARTAQAAQATITSYQQDLHDMRTQGVDPDVWLQANGADVILQQVYAREHEIRRQMDIAQGAARSVAIAQATERSAEAEILSAYVREQLGEPPEPGTPAHVERTQLAHELEAIRLADASADLEGLDRPQLDDIAVRALIERVNEYRGEAGMESIMEPDGPDELYVESAYVEGAGY